LREHCPGGGLTSRSACRALEDPIGTIRSRVNRFMNKFRRLGSIDYNGELKLHSSLLVVLLHDHPQIDA
jgi:CRP/FNR family cyclic AMP-dependent transcriptional regulator